VAARTKGFARKLAAERLAESLGVDAPAQSGDVKAVPLRITPLIAPHRAKGLYTIRLERVPQLARLTRGRNNGNGSWSLTPEEADGVEYIGPDSALDRPALALRLLDNEGGTIAMLELPLDASVAEDLGRESVDPDYLRRLTDELQSARAALAEREKELGELRQAPRPDVGEMQRRLDAAAQAAQEQAKKLWQDDERARFAAAEARWRESNDRAASEAQAKAVTAIRDAEARAAAQIADAERSFRNRLAAAEAKARDAGTAAAAGQAASAEAQRLRDQIAGLEGTLKRRDEDFALMRRDTASAQQRAKDDLAATERQWQAKSADELKRLTARAETAERALAGNRDAQGSRDAELRALQQKLADSDRALTATRETQNARDADLRALQQKLADSDRALIATRDAQNVRDTELRALRDERTALQARLAAADAAPRGIAAATVDRQIEAALSAARQKWEADAAQRLAQAETVFRTQLAAAEQKARSEAAAAVPIGPSAADIARQVEAAVAAAKAEWQAGEPQRIAATEAKVRAELPPPAPKGVAPEAVQAQIDVALASAKSAWKSEETARFTQAEEKWRTDSAAALARLTRRAETAEAALAEAKAAPPPPPMVAAPAARIDQGLIDNLHHEIEELRKALSDREVEAAQLKMTLDARRAIPETKPKFYPAQPREPEHEMRIHDPRRSNGKLIKEVLFVFAIIVVLFVGFPFALPYLPYEVQDSVAQFEASVFGTVPAGYATTPAGKPAPGTAAPAVAATGTPAVIARSANIRASANANADVVTRLKKGDPVIALETNGSWTHIKTANIDGWILTSSLKK
jgi:hypothetical protein